MEQFVHDLRYALRTFARQPAFALTAILALALGIGANTAVFSVVYAVLLRPLPYPDPAALVYVHDTYPAVRLASVSAAKYVALREGNRTLVALGAMTPSNLTITGRGEPEQIPGSRVSAEFFVALQAPAQYGRWFAPEEDRPNAPPVIVISDALWQRRFAGDPRVVGSAVSIDGETRTIVGIMPRDFTYPGLTQAWVPLGIAPNVPLGGNFLRLVGRRRAGVSLAQVRQDLSGVSTAFNRANNLQRDVLVWSLHEFLVTSSRRMLLVLQGAVAFVLLIACANVANLLLARSVSRQRELAIRAALGARRGRIFRQLLTESALLSVLGGMVGILLASWLLRLFLAIAPANFPRAQAIAIDTGVLGFTLTMAILTGILFGLAPARRGFRTDANDSLRESGTRGATSAGARGASRVLVVAEVALAIVLVVGAGLMVKSLLRLQRQDVGFRQDGVLTFELNLPSARYPDATAPPFFARLLGELRGLPGVQSAGAINYLPIANFGFNGPFAIEGRPPFPADKPPAVEFRMVTPGYFATMGIPLRKGQDFTDADSAAGRPVTIINETMASRYWPKGDAVGARIQFGGDSRGAWREVIAVVGDVRSQAIGASPVPEAYVPHAQAPSRGMGIALRLSGADARTVMPIVRQRVAAIDANLPLVRVRTLQAVVDTSSGTTRLQSVLTSVFALVAGLLAAVGIYSLIAYSVAQRTRELGIRVALGADRASVVRLILREALMLASIGTALGLAGTFLLTSVLETMLYEVSPTDPGVLAGTCVGVLTVTLLASLVPAIRALRVDPMIALRAE